MTADISGISIAPNQVAKGTNGLARLRALPDGLLPESGAVSFQSLLGAIELPRAGPTGPARVPGTAPDEALETDHIGNTQFFLSADSAADATPIAAWSASPLLAPAADGPAVASSTGALFATRHPDTLGDAKALDPLARDRSATSTIDVADATDPMPESTESPYAPSSHKPVPWLSASGGADAGTSDDKSAGSPRDFLARVASEADTGASQAKTSGVAGDAEARALIAAHGDAEGSGLRAHAARRPAERFGQRFMAAAAAAAGATPGAEGLSPGTSHGASQVYSPGAATPVPATAVAEKLYHWASRGVQNAQLQLDAFGGGSVDVSISVMGQETIVDFRTDQAQARNLLLEAMPQLKEMLEREGLVFSGGFVGESGHRGSGSQRRDEAREDGRDASVRIGHVKAAGMAQSGRMPGAPGASIDLFV